MQPTQLNPDARATRPRPERPPVTPKDGDPLVLLVARVAEKDRDALASLYDRTSRLVYSMALRVLSQREDAEEVTFDVYMQVWTSAERYDSTRGPVGAWLAMMTRTRAIDRLRARRARLDDMTVPLVALEPPSASPAPDTIVETRATSARVRRALRSIPSQERTLIELAFFGGHSHSELARRLGLPLGTVKTRIRHGLLRLRPALGVTPCEV